MCGSCIVFNLFSPGNPANNTLPIPGWLHLPFIVSMEGAIIVTLGCSADVDYKHVLISSSLLLWGGGGGRAIGSLQKMSRKEEKKIIYGAAHRN